MFKATVLAFLTIAVTVEAFAPIIPKIHKPKPYSFGYTVKDKHGEQHREETGDGVGVVKGSYGFTDERGIHRQVHYVADKAGFRAEVKTNEHGTAPLNPAAVKMISSAHPYLGGAGHIPLAKAFGPLVAGSVPFGVPVVPPGLIKEGLALGYGAPLLGAGAKAAPGILKEDLALGYGGPLKADFITGYDTRFAHY